MGGEGLIALWICAHGLRRIVDETGELGLDTGKARFQFRRCFGVPGGIFLIHFREVGNAV